MLIVKCDVAWLVWCADRTAVVCRKMDAMCLHCTSLLHILESHCDAARYFKKDTSTLVGSDGKYTEHMYIHTYIHTGAASYNDVSLFSTSFVAQYPEVQITSSL
jgi:hypothetical protein